MIKLNWFKRLWHWILWDLNINTELQSETIPLGPWAIGKLLADDVVIDGVIHAVQGERINLYLVVDLVDLNVTHVSVYRDSYR
jgi:hypothetical protein